MQALDLLLKRNIATALDLRGTTHAEKPDYPFDALRELVRNAVIHRTYESYTPVRVTWFANRVEVRNPGSVYGDVTKESLDRPVQALHKWISRIPGEYRRAVLQCDVPTTPTIDTDEHLLANLQEYRSLMPLAQEANKPMFMLKPADGALGAYMNAVVSCYQDYRSLAQKISDKLAASNDA